jgi:hypothetical protein
MQNHAKQVCLVYKKKWTVTSKHFALVYRIIDNTKHRSTYFFYYLIQKRGCVTKNIQDMQTTPTSLFSFVCVCVFFFLEQEYSWTINPLISIKHFSSLCSCKHTTHPHTHTHTHAHAHTICLINAQASCVGILFMLFFVLLFYTCQ